jgi:hypothetical protein
MPLPISFFVLLGDIVKAKQDEVKQDERRKAVPGPCRVRMGTD